jgi:hypothetical protein
MKLLEAITGYIQAQGLGTQGVDLFYGYMPAEIDSGSVVLARVMIDIDPYTGINKGTFQVVSRAMKSAQAYDRAAAIKKVLRLEGAELGGVKFKFILPKHEPLVFPRTDGGQYEASVNYQFVADNWE